MQILKFGQDDAGFEDGLSRSIKQLKAGGLVAIPTETVYGLAGDATNGMAVAKIFEMKKRPQFNPLIAHVCNLEMAQNVGIFDKLSLKLAHKFWPGPLTLVVNKYPKSQVHDLVSGGLDTIAIRCPGGLARQLIEEFGAPLAAPSANRSGHVSPTRAAHVASEFGDEDIIVLDGGACDVGIESTIVRVMDEKIIFLREGSITHEELSQFPNSNVEAVSANAPIQAPGMMISHYAPRSKLVVNCHEADASSAVLSFGAQAVRGAYDRNAHENLSASANLREAASNLYSHIRKLDELGRDKICVAPIPFVGLGIAINDRLTRAAAPRKNTTDWGTSRSAKFTNVRV